MGCRFIDERLKVAEKTAQSAVALFDFKVEVAALRVGYDDADVGKFARLDIEHKPYDGKTHGILVHEMLQSVPLSMRRTVSSV